MSQKLFLTQLKRVSNKSKCNDEMIWKVESRKSKVEVVLFRLRLFSISCCHDFKDDYKMVIIN